MRIENEKELFVFRYGVRLGALQERERIISFIKEKDDAESLSEAIRTGAIL